MQQQKQEKEEREMAQRLEYLMRCYPYAMLTEEERAQEMLEMIRLDIARAIRNNGEIPTAMANCFGRVLRAKHHLSQI